MMKRFRKDLSIPRKSYLCESMRVLKVRELQRGNENVSHNAIFRKYMLHGLDKLESGRPLPQRPRNVKYGKNIFHITIPDDKEWLTFCSGYANFCRKGTIIPKGEFAERLFLLGYNERVEI